MIHRRFQTRFRFRTLQIEFELVKLGTKFVSRKIMQLTPVLANKSFCLVSNCSYFNCWKNIPKLDTWKLNHVVQTQLSSGNSTIQNFKFLIFLKIQIWIGTVTYNCPVRNRNTIYDGCYCNFNLWNCNVKLGLKGCHEKLLPGSQPERDLFLIHRLLLASLATH